MKEDEVNGTCNTHNVRDECMQSFSRKNLREWGHLGNLHVDKRQR
jgi:hypothetical protein